MFTRRTRIIIWFAVIMTALGVISKKANAADLSLTTLWASTHHDGGEYNEKNPGLGLQYNTPDYRIGAMRYLNSHDNMSTMVYFGQDGYKSKYMNVGYNIAAVSGYSRDELAVPVVPMFVVSIHASKNPWVPNIFITGIPAVVTAVGLSWNIL